MLRSMTAFARQESHSQLGSITWEIRSVNHRYLEASVRMPENLRSLEQTVRESVAGRLGRGKVECSLRYQAGSDALATIELNRPLAERVIAVATDLAKLTGSGAGLATADLLRWPGVVNEPQPDLEPVKADVLAVLHQALGDLVETREREGARIAELIKQRCAQMVELVAQLRVRRVEVVTRQREKLLRKINDLGIQVDEGRVEQEVVIAAQRLDVDEELDRLDAHLAEVADVLLRKEPTGRRLDFLMQELNREANTLSSKSADSETTRVAVDLKVLIEQMREQVQNIE